MPYEPDLVLFARGRLTSDPILKFVPGRDGSTSPVCNARFAHTERKRQADGKWVDGDTTWIDLTAWNRAAEMLALLPKGCPIFAEGRFETKQWKNRDGEDKTTCHITANKIGVDITMVRDIEGGQGYVTFRWGKAVKEQPVESGLEATVGQQWDQAAF